ncbi:MYND-type domain-containing protein [Mycena sanguinolenta]|uniref:MYND-type domain-containing protein n=1 Tax=Mycena sanguinolenta TaxID=230812 RepID=A0A8H7CK80_9AGAR|nr:MYND-type domain-containing protein [Mycena sanguinolenta]
MQCTVDSRQIDSSWSFLMEGLSETGVALLLYGVHICLFSLSIYLLARRRETHGRKLLMAWSCIIAAGGTAEMAVIVAAVIEAARFVEKLLHAQVSNAPVFALLQIQSMIVSMNNFATDSLYLYRCYLIWDYRWKILILPGLLMISTFVLGIVGVQSSRGLSVTKPQIVYALAAATNVVLTALTAGRLLWIRRTASGASVNTRFRARCNRALGIILESGVIYCIAVVSLLVAASFNAHEVYVIELGVVSQLLNIIPTFTLVYVGMDDTADKSHRENNPDAPRFRSTAFRSAAVQRSQFTGVLDIKYGGMESKGDEYV